MTRLPFLLVLLLVLPTVRAEPVELTSSLSLDQLVTAALAENAQLHAMRAKWEAMRERPAQARSLANPMFKYSGMDMTDSGSWPNTDEKRFMVEQEFPWFGKRGLKGQIAAKDAEAMGREYEAMQREVVMMVKESYFDLYAVQQSLVATREEEAVLKRMAQIAETMYSTGERSQADVLQAQAECTMLRTRLLELEQQEATLKAKLNLLLNRPADAPVGIAVTPPQESFSAETAGLFDVAASHRAEIKQAQALVERNQAERALMQREFLPDYRLGVEYRAFRSSEDMVMFTIGFDIPIWFNKYRAGVREAEKMIESSEAAVAAARAQTGYDVQDARFKWQTARQTLALYRDELIPQAQARFKASEAGYRTGKTNFMDLLESERFLLNTRVMAAMAEGKVGMEAARLERAVGTELPRMEVK